MSDLANYRHLRPLLTNPGGIANIVYPQAEPLQQVSDIRADQCGIRTLLAGA